MMRVDASVPCYYIVELGDPVVRGDEVSEQDYLDFCAFVNTQVASAERDGRVYILTDSTHKLMSDPRVPVFGRFMREYVPMHLELQRIEHGEFRGFMLRPK